MKSRTEALRLPDLVRGWLFRNGGARDSAQKLQLVLALCQELGVSTRWAQHPAATRSGPISSHLPSLASLQYHTGAVELACRWKPLPLPLHCACCVTLPSTSTVCIASVALRRAEQIGGLWIVPLLSWHHASFDREPEVPAARRHSLAAFADYGACRWPASIAGAFRNV